VRPPDRFFGELRGMQMINILDVAGMGFKEKLKLFRDASGYSSGWAPQWLIEFRKGSLLIYRHREGALAAGLATCNEEVRGIVRIDIYVDKKRRLMGIGSNLLTAALKLYDGRDCLVDLYPENLAGQALSSKVSKDRRAPRCKDLEALKFEEAPDPADLVMDDLARTIARRFASALEIQGQVIRKVLPVGWALTLETVSGVDGPMSYWRPTPPTPFRVMEHPGVPANNIVLVLNGDIISADELNRRIKAALEALPKEG